MPLKIDYAGLEQAMSHYDPAMETGYFFDLETGEVLVVDDWVEEQAKNLTAPDQTNEPTIRLAWYVLWQDDEVGEDLPEADEEAMAEQVEAYLARYPGVPTADSDEGYRDMEDFTATVSDPYLRGGLEAALGGPRPFRRFKDVLYGFPQERQRWFAFRDQRLRERVNEWLRQQGVSPDEPTAE